MSAVALACALAVVDQLDGPVALVELPDGELVHVARRGLPRRVREGARLCVVRSAPNPLGPAAPPSFTRAPRAQPGENHD